MTTITQEPVNIGPVPRCIQVDDGGSTSALLLMSFAITFAVAGIWRECIEINQEIKKLKGTK